MQHFLTADLHINHQNIPLFEPGRARFKDNIPGMNQEIIDNWNAVVNEEDTVDVIGDFGIGNKAEILRVISELKGTIRLWPGNHDHTNFLKELQKIGVIIMPLMTKIKTHGISVLITHYPVDIGERPMLFNVHGHIHSLPSRLRNQINVGVDQDWGLPFGQPIPWSMIEARILEMSAILRKEKENQPPRFY